MKSARLLLSWTLIVCFLVSHHLSEPLHQGLHWLLDETCVSEGTPVSDSGSHAIFKAKKFESIDPVVVIHDCLIKKLTKALSGQNFISASESSFAFVFDLETKFSSRNHEFKPDFARFMHLSRGPPASPELS